MQLEKRGGISGCIYDLLIRIKVSGNFLCRVTASAYICTPVRTGSSAGRQRTWFGTRGSQVRILSSRLRPPQHQRRWAFLFLLIDTTGSPRCISGSSRLRPPQHQRRWAFLFLLIDNRASLKNGINDFGDLLRHCQRFLNVVKKGNYKLQSHPTIAIHLVKGWHFYSAFIFKYLLLSLQS